MRKYFLLSLMSAALCLGPARAAQGGIEQFESREAFAAASSSLTTLDFSAHAPARGFAMYRPPQGLDAGGLSFRVSGGARFGPGIIYLVSPHYAGTNPLYPTGMAPLLSWAAPNQPGNATLDVTLPRGTTAVGADLWTHQPYVGTVEVTATTEDGGARTVVVATRARPAAAFIGFVSESPIISLSFRPPRGQTGMFLDNIAYGRRAEGRAASSPPPDRAQPDARPDTAATTAPAPRPDSRPPAPQSTPSKDVQAAQTTPAQTRPAQPAPTQPAPTQPAQPRADDARPPGAASSSTAARGQIAYVRGGKEIRVVGADGTGDRRFWTHPSATEGAEIHDLSWRPDGEELAFSSSHNNVVSFYHADLYGIRPDGTGLRRITYPPDHGELSRYPKGVVQVTVRNEQPFYRQGQAANTGLFIIYVVGADEPQAVTLPPGASRTLLFKSVADFGDHAQPVVAIYGRYRWFIPGTDVKAGRTVTAPDFGISGDGHELFGAFRPTWRGDGSRLSHRSGLCLVNTTSARPTPGEYVFKPLFAGTHPSGACAWDWGPTPALADQLLYTANGEGDGSAIYRIREGGTHPGERLHVFSELDSQLVLDLRWLPDGSGFLYTFPDLAYEFGNIFRYDFATKRVTQLTNYEGEYARAFDVSPDGAWIVYERAKKWNDNDEVDLWVMRSDGRDARLLVRDGISPSWR